MFKRLMLLAWVFIVSFLDIGPGSHVKANTGAERKALESTINRLGPQIQNLEKAELFELARAYSKLGQSESAVKAYTAVIARNPDDLEAKTLIGAELFLQGKDKEAISSLKEVVDKNPKFVAAYRMLIRIYEKKSNKYELRLIYQDLLTHDGEKNEYLLKLCELTTLDSFYDLSKKYCNRSLQLEKDNPIPYVYLGLMYKDTGEINKADASLRKAADDFPDSFLAQLTLAQHLESKKDFVTAYSFFKAAYSLDRNDSRAMIGYGNTAFELQKFDEVISVFSKHCKSSITLNRLIMPHYRKAANTLRVQNKSQAILRKFEKGIDRCGG
ncbi:MAG: tetratricopeptide repeat protein [Pseudobdellovibrionaceae bacterium]